MKLKSDMKNFVRPLAVSVPSLRMINPSLQMGTLYR